MVSFKRTVFRGINRLLRPLTLELVPTSLDFEARLVSPLHVQRLFTEIGQTIQEWLDTQDVFQPSLRFDATAEASQFFQDYLGTPFRAQSGGSRFGNLLWLNMLSKSMQPDLIVDSGTYRGGSAWALSRGCPSAQIYSFDVDMSQVEHREPNVRYIEKDWISCEEAFTAGERRLFYFDDHIDQGRRLLEAAQRGATLAVFDDDFPLSSFVPMAHDGKALPKISFVLDCALQDGEEIRWVDGGSEKSWRVDRYQLDQLRSLIKTVARLPDISAIVGIGQLPYRIVAVNSYASRGEDGLG
jgi:hypothetical protein